MQQSPLTPYDRRQDAGRQLAQQLLAHKQHPETIVLAVSRGAVPVAEGVAEVLEAPLDVFFLRHLGVPGYEGVSMGTVARSVYLPDQGVIERAGLSLQSFAAAATVAQDELDRDETYLRGGRAAPALIGRTIVLVDEGLTEASDVPVAIEALTRHGAGSIIAAAPLAMQTVRARILKSGHACVCSHTIDVAGELESWYEDAVEVTDELARAALTRAHNRLIAMTHQAT